MQLLARNQKAKKDLIRLISLDRHFLRRYTVGRLNGGSTKNDHKYTTDRVNNADFKNDLHFFVTSSRLIKAMLKDLKSTTFTLQNLLEGREI